MMIELVTVSSLSLRHTQLPDDEFLALHAIVYTTLLSSALITLMIKPAEIHLICVTRQVDYLLGSCNNELFKTPTVISSNSPLNATAKKPETSLEMRM